MVTITNEHGEFTADTEKDALKASRAAKRKAAKEQKVIEERRKIARRYAKANACNVLCNVLEGRNPSGYRVYKPGDKYFPKSTYGDCRNNYAIHTPDGYGSLSLYVSTMTPSMTDKLVGVLVTGGDGCPVVWIETSGEVQTYSLGVHEGETVLHRISDIDIDFFNRTKHPGNTDA